MTKNKGKGGKGWKRGKNADDVEANELVFREDGTNYGYIQKALGNGRFELMCIDGKCRLGILRGNMRKKTWVLQGDMILYGIREFQDGKADIIHKYTDADVNKLYKYQEITQEFYDMHTCNGVTQTTSIADVDFCEEADEFNDLDLSAI